MTDTPITAPDALTALCELANVWDAAVRLRYSNRRYVCAVGTSSIRYAYAEGDSVSGAVELALRELQAAEDDYLATQDDDDECHVCGGSGGGPDAALRCRSCSGRGYR